MDFLCRASDREFFEDESKYIKYMTTLHKVYDKNIYNTYIINNINFDEFDKILADFVTTLNKKVDFYFFR